MPTFLATMAALELERTAPGHAVLHGTVTDDWLQGKSAFGGLQGALGVRAMRAVVDAALPLRALQVTFIASVGAGNVRVVAERVRQGRAVTHAQCRMESGGQTAALMVGLFGAPRASQARLPMAPPPAGVKRRGDATEAAYVRGVTPPFLQHYRTCWVEGERPFSSSPPRPHGLWARLRDLPPASEPPDAAASKPPDAAASDPVDAPASDRGAAAGRLGVAAFNELNLIALADLPPSPVLSMLAARAPGASLTWLLEFLVDPRGFDSDGWLLIRTDARAAGDGYSSQTALIWDESDHGVAVSHQTVAVFD
jgi:acyl-CoA thioesterase